MIPFVFFRTLTTLWAASLFAAEPTLEEQGVFVLKKPELVFVGGRNLNVPKGGIITRDLPSGTILSIYAPRDTTRWNFTVKGQEILFSHQEAIVFHPNGALSAGVLARDTVVKVFGVKMTLKGGTGLILSSNGNFSTIDLALPARLRLKDFTYEIAPKGPGFYSLMFDESGCVELIQLNRETEITVNGLALKLAKDAVGFYDTGDVSMVTLAREATFETQKGKVIAAPDLVWFHDNGRPRRIQNAIGPVHHGVVELDRDGKIARGRPEFKKQHHGKICPQ